jgi:hypothetical protein
VAGGLKVSDPGADLAVAAALISALTGCRGMRRVRHLRPPDAAALTALGLHALQHRGQEAAGIVSFDGGRSSIPSAMSASSATLSPKPSVIDACPATWPSATPLFHHRRAPSCATCSRCSPNSSGGFAIATTATSPTP